MAITEYVEKAIRRLIKLAAKDLRLQEVYLFGSAARGYGHKWSDIDLAIVSPDFSGDSFEDSKMLFPYILQVDTAIEVHTFHPTDFTSNNPFVKEILVVCFINSLTYF